MTIHVEPSSQRGEANHDVISITSRWGRTPWIVPSGVDIEATRAGLAGAPLNGAAITTSGSSLDVSIDTFEAFIGGAWLGSDDATNAEHTHTLAGSSTTTTLYLGYDLSAGDTFIFGPAGDFSASDPKIPIADVTDDGTGVTDEFDRRPLGPRPDLGHLIDATFNVGETTEMSLDTGTLTTTYPEYRVAVYTESPRNTEFYQKLQLNGITTFDYIQDIYQPDNNTFTSSSSSSWNKIAGTDADDATDVPSWAQQVVSVKLPPKILESSVNNKHWPIFETLELGVGEGIKYGKYGHLESAETSIERVHVHGGSNRTGWIAIYGVSRIIGQ